MSAEYNAKFANTDIATRAIHAGQEPDPTTGAVVTPIFATSTFKQDGVLGLRGGHDYSRSINPTRTSFDEQLAAVEGGKYALSFSSGLAAIDVLLRSTIKPGDNILLGNDVYGGTYRLLSKVFVPWGVGLDVVNITDLKAVETALASKHYQYVWVDLIIRIIVFFTIFMIYFTSILLKYDAVRTGAYKHLPNVCNLMLLRQFSPQR